MLKKMLWFLAILIAVMAATTVLFAAFEPGNTNAGELGCTVGRAIVPILLVTTGLYFVAKRMGWILRGTARPLP